MHSAPGSVPGAECFVAHLDPSDLLDRPCPVSLTGLGPAVMA